MNDIPLSQNLGDYDADTQKLILAIFEEEKEKTRAMLQKGSDAPAVVIGSVGFGGTFDALAQ